MNLELALVLLMLAAAMVMFVIDRPRQSLNARAASSGAWRDRSN